MFDPNSKYLLILDHIKNSLATDVCYSKKTYMVVITWNSKF